MTRKTFLLWVQMLLVQLVILLLVLEAILRVWYFFHNRAEPPFSYITEDVGWRSSADLSFSYDRKNYGKIDYSSTRDGFRSYGDINSQSRKVLVVGDSFTQAYHVSDGKPYYDQLGDLAKAEIFAIAAGGYGTLQQSMMITEYGPEISPDIVIWQFTGNDFINNDWFLESQSNENSSHMRRPFWEQGQVTMRHPDGWLGNIAHYSFLARRLLVIRGSFRKRSEGSIEDHLDAKHPDLARSITTTSEVIEKTIAEFPDADYYGFFAGREYYAWELEAFAQVCLKSMIKCVPEVHQTLAAAIEAGEKVDGGGDGHWNELGHRMAAEVLFEALNADDVLTPMTPGE